MGYKIKCKKKVGSGHLSNFDGYPMASGKHKFVIEGMAIKNILVMDKAFVSSLVSKKVMAKYEKLIKTLTELLVSDDETGVCFHEALNLIEKFRLEIKNKYRHYLKEKELKKMANKLKTMQQIAVQKQLEVTSFVAESSMGKSR